MRCGSAGEEIRVGCGLGGENGKHDCVTIRLLRRAGVPCCRAADAIPSLCIANGGKAGNGRR